MARIKSVTIRRDDFRAFTYEQIVIEDGSPLLAEFKFAGWMIHALCLGRDRVWARFERKPTNRYEREATS